MDEHLPQGTPSHGIRLDEDVIPLPEFRARTAEFVHLARETGRPMLITLRGRGIAVLLDVREFEAMRRQIAGG